MRSFSGYPERCPLLYSPVEGWHLVRYVVGRCKHCGKPMIPGHSCVAEEVVYWKTRGLLESLRAEKEGVSFGGGEGDFDSPVLLGGGERPDDRRTAISLATRGTTRGTRGGLNGPPAHSLIRTQVKKGHPNHRDVSRYHRRNGEGVYVTEEEVALAKKEKEQRKEERRKRRFLQELNDMSPKNKDKDKRKGFAKGGRRRGKKSEDRHQSDKMEGYISGMNGLLRLPNANNRAYENEMSWLFRNHCATSNMGAKKKKKKKNGVGSRFVNKIPKVDELQAAVNQKRQIENANRAYEKLMEEDAEKKFSLAGGGGFRASLAGHRYDDYRDFKGHRRRRSFGEVDVEE